jgi:WXG100 family type VII secretion target
MAEKSEVNYEQLENMVKRFRTEADAVNQLLTQTRSRVEGLHGTGWIGRGSEQFFGEMEQTILPAMGRLVQALHTASNAADSIAKIYHSAEDQGQGIFKALGE